MNKVILIADNDKSIRVSLGHLLRSKGYIVTTAPNGRVAMDIILSNEATPDRVSLVIADPMMEVVNSPKLIDEIRKLERRIPILVISGRMEEDIVKLPEAMDLEGIVKKPFLEENLMQKVDEILSISKKHVFEFGEGKTKKKLKILLVEDDDNIQFLVQAMFPDNEFSNAENGVEALEILQERKDFDAILLDLHLPIMNGDMFMKEMSISHPDFKVPVVMITAECQKEEVESAELLAKELGFKLKYLVKPLEQNQIQTAFEELGVR